jgi:uncharacterized protein with GYD domain
VVSASRSQRERIRLEEALIPRYLFEASHTLEGVRRLQGSDGTARRNAVAKAAESVGGRLETFDFAFGDRDAYVIAEAPDDESAAAIALTVNGSGAVSVRAVVLLSPRKLPRPPSAPSITSRRGAETPPT